MMRWAARNASGAIRDIRGYQGSSQDESRNTEIPNLLVFLVNAERQKVEGLAQSRGTRVQTPGSAMLVSYVNVS